MNECCGTCKYNMFDVQDGEYCCNNIDSDSYGCQTAYDDYCMDYEERGDD